MNLELKGQCAIVFGAARGIGLAIARAFTDEGADVVLVDRDASVMQTALDMEEVGAVCDVTDLQSVRKIRDEALPVVDHIDHVVFAVAVGSGKFGYPFWNLEPSDWPGVLAVNLIGAVNVAHVFAPLLIEAKAGTMLFLGSVAGQIGSQTDPPYSASKAALINFAQCAARDLAPYGVRVNTICPGMVPSALSRSVWESWARQQPQGQQQTYEEWGDEKVRRLVPLGRWQTPEDVASMAVFLASERGANITGQTINVDGGYVMHW